MSAAVSPWTCPQCQRRVPGREPLCHCGFARPGAAAAGRPGAAGRPPERAPAPWAAVAMALGACVFGVVAYVAVRPREPSVAAAPIAAPGMRGPVGYPALPPVPATNARRGRRAGATAAAVPAAAKGLTSAPPVRPLTAVEQDWARAMGLLDLPLRKIGADTSVLELSYRPFAEACVDLGDPRFSRGPVTGDWLGSLKAAALRPGVTLRDRGTTVDCETARKSLVARADALKADLATTEKMAQTNRVAADHWRQLLARHELTVWDRY